MRLCTIAGVARLALRLAALGLVHRPPRRTIAQRLAALPTRGLPLDDPVDIRWNDRLVPLIDARSDRDLAVALGLVHAHLRLAQIELLRRIAQGRLAEIVGAVAVPLDHTLRLLDPTRAVPQIESALPAATAECLAGFVAGINHHIANAPEPPVEFRLLGITAAPWTISDVLGIARLAAADVNWLLWMRLLRLPRGPDWPEIWADLVADGIAPLPGLGGGRDSADAFARIVLGLGRAGSNALAVAGRRSASGGAWLAGDPHLSLSLPSVWLAAAYRSPSYNVAGLMIPGIPVMAIGRNRRIAWGGTNLHAGSSELFDVSTLPAGEIAERPVRIAVRWSRPRDIVLRETGHGPIITDAPLFGGARERRLALRWIGHQPSDEISALLAINRAGNWADFRRAAERFAVPGQNLVYADAEGRVGRLTATRLPRRPALAPADIVSPPEAAAYWADRVGAADLPAIVDPPRGLVVSANERPPPSEVPIGWFFAPNDRAERMTVLLRANERIGLGELAELQCDVAAPGMLALRDRLCIDVEEAPPSEAVWRALAEWDGVYDPDSAGALAFELVLARLVEAVLPPGRRALYAAVWHGRILLARDLGALAPDLLARKIPEAVVAAQQQFARLRRWGRAHRLRLAHPLGAMPAIGRRYRHIDWPWPGSSETLLKSAHGLVVGRHPVAYGSNARYVFDLSDPDGNHLVVLGGQDGMPGSPAFLDQAELFRRGEYVTVPLDPTTGGVCFPHRTMLQPAPRR